MKTVLFSGIFVAFLLGLSACNGSYSSVAPSPGGVLDDRSSKQVENRVVEFEVIGKGVAPEMALTRGQALLMAERAAVADGYRQFVEKIRGVYVNAHMKSGYGAVNWEALHTHTQSWLRGVEVVEIRQGPLGIVEAHMRLRVNFTETEMLWWPFKGNGISG